MHYHAERGNDQVAGAGISIVPHAPRGNAARDAPRSASGRVTQSVTGCITTQSVGTIMSQGLVYRSFLTLRVGMPPGTLRVPLLKGDAERHGMHYHAERGNDQVAGAGISIVPHAPRGNAARDAPRSASEGRRRASRAACPRGAWERSNPHLPLCPPPGQNAQKIEQIAIFHCHPHPPNLDPNNPPPDQGHNKND